MRDDAARASLFARLERLAGTVDPAHAAELLDRRQAEAWAEVQAGGHLPTAGAARVQPPGHKPSPWHSAQRERPRR